MVKYTLYVWQCFSYDSVTISAGIGNQATNRKQCILNEKILARRADNRNQCILNETMLLTRRADNC